LRSPSLTLASTGNYFDFNLMQNVVEVVGGPWGRYVLAGRRLSRAATYSSLLYVCCDLFFASRFISNNAWVATGD
jgi:hypothetical protein